MYVCLGERGATAGDGRETSSALGTENGPCVGPDFVAVESGEKAMQALQKEQENFGASAAGGDARPTTPPPKKTRTAAPTDAAQGGAECSQAQRLSARAPGEGPLTTLDSPEGTRNELDTDTRVHDTRHDQAQNASMSFAGRVGAPSGRRQHGQKCRKCHVWACNTACGRDVVDLQCCRMSGVVSHEAKSQRCSQGLGSSAVEGTPRSTQGMEQAMGVQRADVQMEAEQSDLHPPRERVAYRAALQVVPAAFPVMVGVPMETENGQPDADRFGNTACVPGAATLQCASPQQFTLGPRRSCWSWLRHCWRCEPSGTSRGD